MAKVGKKKVIWFFGDSELYLDQPVMAFEYGEVLVVCDFTECGIYVASKRAEKAEIKPIGEILLEIDPNTPIKAENNVIAQYFSKNGLKTVHDLLMNLWRKDSTLPKTEPPFFSGF